MLYLVLKRTIQRGGYDAAAMQTKLDVFYAADRITQAQYEELSGLIGAD
jgi:hypothetical protein